MALPTIKHAPRSGVAPSVCQAGRIVPPTRPKEMTPIEMDVDLVEVRQRGRAPYRCFLMGTGYLDGPWWDHPSVTYVTARGMLLTDNAWPFFDPAYSHIDDWEKANRRPVRMKSRPLTIPDDWSKGDVRQGSSLSSNPLARYDLSP